MAAANESLLNPDSSDNEDMPEVKIDQDLCVVGKAYHWGKLLTAPIGSKEIFKDVKKARITRNCHLTVIMRHDEEMKHPSLSPEWKVQRILLKKFMLSQDFMSSWTRKEAFNADFAQTMEQLPCIFTPDNLNEFETFFEKYGHGFLKSGYVGGEVYLKITDKDNFDSIDYESDEDPLLKMNVDQFVFRGGNPKYHQKAHLKEWRKSLYSHPTELILDQDMDVIFYHDFVPALPWLRNRRARGEALEEALAALEEKFLGNMPVQSKEECPSQKVFSNIKVNGGTK